MKKLLLIIVVSAMSVSVTAVAAPFQSDCLGDFLGCMNDAQVAYDATVGAIENSEAKAREDYVIAARACVASYRTCPKR